MRYKLILNGRLLSDRELPEGTYLIGRDNACAIPLQDSAVSWKHASLSVGPRGITIEDLQSTNGTFVNGKKIKNKTKTSRNTEISIGPFLLQCHVSSADEPFETTEKRFVPFLSHVAARAPVLLASFFLALLVIVVFVYMHGQSIVTVREAIQEFTQQRAMSIVRLTAVSAAPYLLDGRNDVSPVTAVLDEHWVTGVFLYDRTGALRFAEGATRDRHPDSSLLTGLTEGEQISPFDGNEYLAIKKINANDIPVGYVVLRLHYDVAKLSTLFISPFFFQQHALVVVFFLIIAVAIAALIVHFQRQSWQTLGKALVRAIQEGGQVVAWSAPHPEAADVKHHIERILLRESFSDANPSLLRHVGQRHGLPAANSQGQIVKQFSNSLPTCRIDPFTYVISDYNKQFSEMFGLDGMVRDRHVLEICSEPGFLEQMTKLLREEKDEVITPVGTTSCLIRKQNLPGSAGIDVIFELQQ